MWFLQILRLILAGWSGRDFEEVDTVDLPPRVDPPEPDQETPSPETPSPDPPIRVPVEDVDIEGGEEKDSGKEKEAEDFGPATLLVRAMREKGYRVFDDNSKDLNLNIVGIRDTGAQVDEFACKIAVFWKSPAGDWKMLQWDATTYPGSRYLVEKLLNSKGAAILVPGQYPVYRLDTHNGKYEAVCQRRGPVRVYRDGDRDREFDMRPSSVMEGHFGINIHAPVTPSSGMKAYIAQRVYAASAGCQVFRKVADFLEFRALCRRAAALWGNAFTYTLLEDIDLHRIDVTLPESVPGPGHFDNIGDGGSSSDDPWRPEGDTAGVRNKNLLNVKGTGWKYSLGRDDRGHNRFPTYAKGLRAGIITLRSYWTRHKKRTVADILSRWAPATDTIGSLPGAPPNSPRDYSLFVAKRMGIEPTSPLSTFHDDGSVNDEEQLFQLIAAMAAYENYAGLDLPRDVFEEGLALV